jgi:hypothetical protein
MVLSPSIGANNSVAESPRQIHGVRQIPDIVQRNKSGLARRAVIDRLGTFPYVLGLA